MVVKLIELHKYMQGDWERGGGLGADKNYKKGTV